AGSAASSFSSTWPAGFPPSPRRSASTPRSSATRACWAKTGKRAWRKRSRGTALRPGRGSWSAIPSTRFSRNGGMRSGRHSRYNAAGGPLGPSGLIDMRTLALGLLLALIAGCGVDPAVPQYMLDLPRSEEETLRVCEEIRHELGEETHVERV